MAKTIAQHYAEIINIKDTQSALTTQLLPQGNSSVENLNKLLSQLNSSSKVSIWRLWAWITATFAWITDVSFDKKRDEIQKIADTAIIGNNQWLVNASQDFRYNTVTNNMVPLVVDLVSKQFVYANATLQPNETQPINRATIIRFNAGFTNLLVATTSGNTFQKVSPLVLSAFKDYITKYKQFVGTNIQVYSRDADILSYNLTIRFDFTKGTANPEQAIKDAIVLATQTMAFDGKLEKLNIEDLIQKVVGVIGIVGSYKSRNALSSVFLDWTNQGVYNTVAGYINVSTVPSEAIITLIPND